MPKETIRIDGHALGPTVISLGFLECERHLERYRNQIRDEGLVFFAEEIEAYSYETRER